MDLHPIDQPPTSEESSAVDAVLGAPDPTSEEPKSVTSARAWRHLLLPALRAVQERVGWVSAGALGYICRRLSVPPAEGFGVASFYHLLALEPRPKVVAHVCDDIACLLAGADRVCGELERTLGPAGPGAGWMRSPCLGLCERAPAAMLTAAGEAPFEASFGPTDAAGIAGAVRAGRVEIPRTPPPPQADAGALRLARRVGRVDPDSLDDYRRHGGYQALRRALELSPAGVVREITDSKLLGRGGAAFPTGRKWDAVAKAAVRPHYVVCNADESEPGTFKDRVIMEGDPFALVEAMTIAGYATASETGFVYIRGEYALAAERLGRAIARARAHGFLGPDVMGRGFGFDIELRRGAGAYICGEETALFASIEGFRGEPRSKPPFPVDSGLFGKPTAINNVETLVSVLDILTGGAQAWASLGSAGSTGSKLFCLSGRIARPGLYEVPFGTRLSDLIALAGGVPGGRRIQAVLMGGAAGAFLTPAELDVPLTFEDLRRVGATLGSGVVMVFDDTVALLPILHRIAEFFRDESCGQCVPCRVGTVRQQELLARLAPGRARDADANDRRLIAEVGQVMRDASICGLGQTASAAIESALRKLDLDAVLEQP